MCKVHCLKKHTNANSENNVTLPANMVPFSKEDKILIKSL